MSYKDKYKRYANTEGGIREQRVRDTQNFLMQSFEDSPSFERVWVNNQTSPTPVQIVYNGKIPTIKTLLMYPEVEIALGDIIKRKYEGKWLVEYRDENDIYSSATIEKCNEELRWIDEQGAIKIYPIVLKGSTSIGVDEDNILNLPAGERVALVQSNSETRKIKRDDRFIFGKEAFKVIDYDYITQEGILKLSVRSDGIRVGTDNLDLGIADYYTKLNDLDIVLAEPDSLNLGIGQTDKIDLRVVGEKGVVDVPVTFKSNNEEIVKVDSDGVLQAVGIGEAEIEISIPNGKTKNLKIVVIDGTATNYRSEIVGPDSIVFGKTASYIVNYYNNDIPESQQTLFTLVGDNGLTTKSASIVKQDQQLGTCSVKATDVYSTKAVNVVLIATATNGAITQKIIRIAAYLK